MLGRPFPNFLPSQALTSYSVLHFRRTVRADLKLVAEINMSYSSLLDSLPRHVRIAESSLTIGDEIGRGSFGVVRKGVFNGQPVCIKVCVGLCAGLIGL
jgi:hypothetical protein